MHAVLALFLPGYAQARNVQRGKALFVAGAFLALLLAAGTTPWLHSFAGLVSFLLAVLVSMLLSYLDARRHRGVSAPAVLRPAEWALLALPALLLFVVLVARPVRRVALGVEAFRIPPGYTATAPALRGGERFLADMRPHGIERGVLAFFPDPEKPERTLVKRVVGLAGDSVHGSADGVYVNGALVIGGLEQPFDMLVVPPGEVFAVGDNLERSRDSRHFGCVPVRTIIGRALFVVWGESWERIGKTLR